MSLLEAKNIRKIYKTRFGGAAVEALKNVSFSVEQGEYVAIMGESGSGKTTLLNILAALDKATEGRVILDGTDIGTIKEKNIAGFRRDNLGYVFQDFNLLDTFSLEDNIYLPLVLAGKKPDEMKESLDRILEPLGIEKLLKKYPYEVSGGQKQRAAVARALITNPRIILADEPTGALDSRSSDELLGLFKRVNQMGQTILMVTHSVKAASHASRVLFIKDVNDYNRVFGHDEELSPGEALVGTAKKIEIGDVLTVADVSFRIKKRIDSNIREIDPFAEGAASPTVFVIVNDIQSVAKNYIGYEDYNGEPMLAWFWNCRFDTGLDNEGQIALAETLDNCLGDELKGLGFSNYYCDSHELERGDFFSTFGGLFFLGIMLSIIFLVSCVIIIYYKQVSEGFEDRARFEIMQKVGMTKDEIKKSINSQMLTVFMIPIVFACIHLAVVLPIVNKLLMLFGLFDFKRLLITSGVCVVLFGMIYAVVYKLTSNAYYKIVS